MKTNRRANSSREWIYDILIGILCVIIAALGWYLYDNNVDRSGWMEKDGVYYYRDFHARRVSGWQEINGNTYYFGQNTAMATGWQDIDQDIYYFGHNGVMRTQWQQIDGSTYYFGDSGTMHTGWQDVEGKRYLLADDGTMQTGWQEINSCRYYLGSDGSMRTDWQTIDSETYYFNAQGIMTQGFLQLQEDCYYFGEDGAMVIGPATLEEGQYLFGEDGRMHTGWFDTEEGRRYYQENGVMALSCWQEIEGKRYWFGDTGTMHTGWLTQGEYSYYLQEDGSAATSPTRIDGYIHYFTPKGIHVVLVNAKNYVPVYYKLDLVTVTGWHQVQSVCLEPLKQMIADCEAAGNPVTFNSAHRTIEEQTAILEARTKEHMENYDLDRQQARAKALQSVAIPGTSEHHLGLAVDLMGYDAIPWLTEHCWEYGFIVRYTEDKQQITGIMDEPWHFRYVGTEVSLDMKDSGLCLEEYLGADPVRG